MSSAKVRTSPAMTRDGGVDIALPTLLTVLDVAEALKVSTRTVRRLIKSGALPSVRVGRSIRVRAEDLTALTRPR